MNNNYLFLNLKYLYLEKDNLHRYNDVVFYKTYL